MITSLELFCFLLIGWWLWNRQVVGLDLGYELFEVFMHVEVAANFGLAADAEFDRDGSCCVIITVRESDGDIDSKDISW